MEHWKTDGEKNYEFNTNAPVGRHWVRYLIFFFFFFPFSFLFLDWIKQKSYIDVAIISPYTSASSLPPGRIYNSGSSCLEEIEELYTHSSSLFPLFLYFVLSHIFFFYDLALLSPSRINTTPPTPSSKGGANDQSLFRLCVVCEWAAG